MPFDATDAGSAVPACRLCPVQTCMSRQDNDELSAAWPLTLPSRIAVMPGPRPLFTAGDPQHFIYAVRGGCLKTFNVDAEGNEHTHGFFLPGDIVGLDSLNGNIHLSNAAAVAPSQVCATPLPELKRSILRHPSLAIRLQEQASRELALALALSGNFTADQRLAAFLLNLRGRLGAGRVLHLPMAQTEIGRYLRMASETVCRVLKGFERRKWLVVRQHTIRFFNEGQLRELAVPVGLPLNRSIQHQGDVGWSMG